MNKAIVYAKSYNLRISALKVRPVMDMVRGKSVTEADRLLTFDRTKGAKLIKKTLTSVVANAKNNLDLKEENLYISDLYANEGVTFKRFRAGSKGRVNPILKRTSHIVVGLSERTKKGGK